MFKVGQKVVCVDDSPCRNTGKMKLVKDEIYTIIGINPYPNPIGLVLKEAESTYGYNGFCSSRFRPLDHAFGEQLGEELEQEINEEQLILS